MGIPSPPGLELFSISVRMAAISFCFSYVARISRGILDFPFFMVRPVEAEPAFEEATTSVVGQRERSTAPPNPETLLPVMVQAEAVDVSKQTRRNDCMIIVTIVYVGIER
jgi:hypothetical protein